MKVFSKFTTDKATYEVRDHERDQCAIVKSVDAEGWKATYYIPWSDLRPVAQAMIRAADARDAEARLAKRVAELRDRFGRWAETFAWIEAKDFVVDGYSAIRAKSHRGKMLDYVLLPTGANESCRIVFYVDADGFRSKLSTIVDAPDEFEGLWDRLDSMANLMLSAMKGGEGCSTSNERPS